VAFDRETARRREQDLQRTSALKCQLFFFSKGFEVFILLVNFGTPVARLLLPAACLRSKVSEKSPGFNRDEDIKRYREITLMVSIAKTPGGLTYKHSFAT